MFSPLRSRPGFVAALVGLLLCCLFATAVGPQQTAAQDKEAGKKTPRVQSTNNLKRITLAMYSYDNAHKCFPAHAIYSNDGKMPLLSWRVAILPYLGQEALYKEFKLDQPWDSEHNKKLISRMPKVYDCSAAPEKVSKEGKTFYQVFTGELNESVFPRANRCTRINQITDGTSNTILAVEAKEPVVWTKPEDLAIPKDQKKMPAVGGLFKEGFNVAFCDGVVYFFRPDPPATELRALVTPNGGEDVFADLGKLLQKEN
jgi:hypothetical protein